MQKYSQNSMNVLYTLIKQVHYKSIKNPNHNQHHPLFVCVCVCV